MTPALSERLTSTTGDELSQWDLLVPAAFNDDAI